MKRVAVGLLGAFVGYLAVALTVGWFISNRPLLAVCYVVAVVVGFVLAYRRMTPQTAEAP